MFFPFIKSKKEIKFLNPDDILRQSGIKIRDVVAELGCGSGHYVYEASKMIGPKGIVFAVDIQKPALSEIKSKIKLWNLRNVKLVKADLEKIGSTKIPENSIDLAILVSTLHQAKNRRNMFLEAKRMLKNNSRLVIVDWKKQGAQFGPKPDLRLDEKQLKIEVRELGFKFVKDIETDVYHFGFLVKK